MIIVIYLASIVTANLLILQYGASASVFNAFVFIALDLTIRDTLHERWGKSLWARMLLLIASGGVLSALFSLNAITIAIASCVAFIGAGIADTLIYSLLIQRGYLIKVNGSNIVGAFVDSVLFTSLAFGSPLFALPQFVAKVAGGFVWSAVLWRFK